MESLQENTAERQQLMKLAGLYYPHFQFKYQSSTDLGKSVTHLG